MAHPFLEGWGALRIGQVLKKLVVNRDYFFRRLKNVRVERLPLLISIVKPKTVARHKTLPSVFRQKHPAAFLGAIEEMYPSRTCSLSQVVRQCGFLRESRT